MSIHPEQHPLDGKLEPETKDCFNDRAPLYSIAISLKRIADAPSEAAARITELEGEVQAGIREILALRADAERASPVEPSGWPEKVREFIDNWFAPWGSWKTEWWEDVSGDREMTHANALLVLRSLLPPTSEGGGDG